MRIGELRIKKELILGITLMLLVVGLSGCNDEVSEQLSGETSIKDITEHPDNYINQTVTVRAYISIIKDLEHPIYTLFYSPGYVNVRTSETSYIRAIETDDTVKPTPFDNTAEYKWTGIVRYGVLPLDYLNETYIELIKIEEI